MPQLRLALAQIDTTVGDLAGNAATIRARTSQADAAGAHLVVFPEMCLTGYPVEDLALRPSFVAASRAALQQLADELAADGHGEVAVVVGYLDSAPGPGHRAQNCAALLHRGEVVARYAKNHLPTTGVFDEHRIFVPGTRGQRVRHAGVDVALLVCEDLWRDGGVTAQLTTGGPRPGLVVVVNASPYERGKDDVRYDLVRNRAVETGCTIAYVNAVGGQDELVFDGDSMVVGPDGTLLARAPQFVADLLLVDLDLPAGSDEQHDRERTEGRPSDPGYDLVPTDTPALEPYSPATPCIAEPLGELEEIYRALVLGLAGYIHKNRFRQVVFGLSGGIDSALVAAIACDAIDPADVHTVALPSRHSSEHSLADAADLAARAGTSHRLVPIQTMVDAFRTGLTLSPLAEENLQARVRGVILMAISNTEGQLVLSPGNKSELAVGYSTIYGDAVGGFAPIKDVPKTLVWELARWRNAEAGRRGEVPPIPVNSIDKPPSAELAPGQVDSDSLPDYAVLDAIIDGYVVGDSGRDELLGVGIDAEVIDRVVRLVDAAEWKRRQFPIGTKISSKAFGRDRRLPVSNRWRES